MSNKVVWQEGMALSPHHFQQAENFIEHQIQAKWRCYSPYMYGISKIEVEPESLEMGNFSLSFCAGIFSDGSFFSFPKVESELASRSFADSFPAEKETLGVYLAIPDQIPDGSNYSSSRQDNNSVRYIGKPKEVADMNTGGNTRPLDFCQLNLKILFEGEVLDGFQHLKIAELARDPQGQVILNDSYIPPLLNIAASHYLMQQLKKLVDIGTAKANYLMSQRAQKSSSVAQFSAETLTSYLLLSVINRFLPRLSHYFRNPHIHPELFFAELLEVAGAMLSFAADKKASDLPPYSHNDLRGCFSALFQVLVSLLESTVATDFLFVPLTRTSPVQYMGNLKELQAERLNQFYLGVTAQAAEVDIINAVQRNAKLGPATKINLIVDAAMGGIGLVPEAHPPGSLPVKAGYKYFRLMQTGDLWGEIMQSRTLALHMPASLPGLKLELAAILK